jgi:hypothetical protein
MKRNGKRLGAYFVWLRVGTLCPILKCPDRATALKRTKPSHQGHTQIVTVIRVVTDGVLLNPSRAQEGVQEDKGRCSLCLIKIWKEERQNNKGGHRGPWADPKRHLKGRTT